LRVENASLLEGFGDDGNRRIDGVRDDEDVCGRRYSADGRSKVTDDGGVGLLYT
jgi:hypothetical protein